VNLFEARKQLEQKAMDAGIINAERKAEYIFEHFSGLSKEDLFSFGNEYELQPWKYAQMVRAVNRLIAGTPVQLILGYTYFYDDVFLCKKGVLIPRPETESLVDAAIEEIDSREGPLRVLDLFTGSGIIAISLAKARPEHEYVGSDLSRMAINLATKNAKRIGVDIHWRVGDMFAPFAKGSDRFDIITANPPYIPSRDIKSLPLDVRKGDPRDALDGGRDGLKFHTRLAREAHEFLNDGGCLIVEMGFDQRKAVNEIFEPKKVRFIKDLWRKDRIYIVRY
jgi:release factor glutamine methyltransferase